MGQACCVAERSTVTLEFGEHKEVVVDVMGGPARSGQVRLELTQGGVIPLSCI